MSHLLDGAHTLLWINPGMSGNPGRLDIEATNPFSPGDQRSVARRFQNQRIVAASGLDLNEFARGKTAVLLIAGENINQTVGWRLGRVDQRL
jgi:hypothetical protein